MENFVPYSTFFVILLLHIYHVMYMTFDYFHFIYSINSYRKTSGGLIRPYILNTAPKRFIIRHPSVIA